MSDVEGKNDKGSGGEGAEPTQSFEGLVKGAGEQIGPFRIERELGRGAVGVVYLAHDTKLDRPVAIKSLPAEVMENPKARSRFKREAKVLASLNHPNIATIYDELEEAEGVGYLILEYIPGQTLAERIGRGALKLEEALTTGLQIAEAVAAAHEHDVIHRDLKPGNIKITPEGKVKVLDFGLAKAVGGKALDTQSTVTEPGRVIGTPAYMSPEQARGKETDKRSDIWSFGCVLYEILTGKLPFKGETVSDTLARILEREPDWELLPASTPANIRSLLQRCLKKDPHRRLRDIGDASIEISETLSLLTVTVPTVEKLQPARLRQLVVVIACLVFVAIAASVVTWKLKRPSAPPSKPVRHFVIHPKATLGVTGHQALALSPDGRRLAYVGQDSGGTKIYLREMDEFKGKPLPGTENAGCLFFSPDGEWVGFTGGFEGRLKKVSVKGGEPIILCNIGGTNGGSWGADGTIVFASGNTGLWRVSASGEGLERLTVPDANQDEGGHYLPQILPGCKAVLFINSCWDEVEGIVEVYSLETSERRVLFKGGTNARYVPTGHIIYGSKETMYAVGFDIEQLKVVGSGVPVVAGVMTEFIGRSAQFAISGDGTLAYVPVQAGGAEVRPVWVDRDGRVEPLPGAAPGNYNAVSISPDGSQAAFDILVGDTSDVRVYDLKRHTLNRLTFTRRSCHPIWYPDGKRVISWLFGEKPQVFWQRVDGSGEPELLAKFECWGILTSCSPNGKEMLAEMYYPKRPDLGLAGGDIWVFPLEQRDKSQPRPFIQRGHHQGEGVWSPDGRWVAYSSNETRRSEVYVEPYPGPGLKVRISTEGGGQPVWSRDGKELFYRCGDKIMAASVETEPEFRVTSSKVLFEGQYLMGGLFWFRNYDVAPDGRFIMIQESGEETPPCIHVVLNWFEELKRLVPVGKD